MTRTRPIYWICQTVGWGLYGLINTAFIAVFAPFSGSLILANFLVCAAGVLITHGFRRIVHRMNWRGLAFGPLMLRIVPASLIMAILLELSCHVSAVILPDSGRRPFDLTFSLMRDFNFTVVFFLWCLIYFGVQYFQNFRKSEIEKLRLAAALKDAELLTLKTQMNPHFLFNALNSIRALTIQDPAKAQEAVTRLANILRYTLQSGGKETVTLEEEMAMVRDYLELETVRFEERLDWQASVAPETRLVLVPAMMIQTLVENAIKHGIAQLPRGGRIRIETSFQNGDAAIRITNSGGLRNEPNGTGLGIANVRQRLNLLYGTRSSFTLSASGDEVTAEVKIPKGGV